MHKQQTQAAAMGKYRLQEATAHSRSPGSSSPVSSTNPDLDQLLISTPTMWQPKVPERFEKRDGSCFVTSKIPTDITVQINNITFHFHKFPLVSKSGYMSQLDLRDQQSDHAHYDYDIKMDNFPGGPDTFELILKFCYGLPIGLTPANVVPLRCAAEFLEMTEDVADGNLVSKTESFITFAVLTSWRDTISVLRSCTPLSPWAENLQIVRRCCDSIARKAAGDVEEAAGGEERWWFDDVCVLGISHFVRVITLIRAKGSKPETIGACLERYATKWLPGFDHVPKDQVGRSEIQLSILSGADQSGAHGVHNKEERTTLENLISVLPPEREAIPCRFLLWMLKMATIYSVSPALLSELEKRVGMVLEDATVNDLLIPNYPTGEWNPATTTTKKKGVGDGCTMHNVEMVYRIIEYFLMQEEQHKRARTTVGRLLDGYLAEIARDPNLTPASFQAVAEALPTNSRSCDDGLYRAVDIYLKAHPNFSEHERRRLCRVMDCDKLSVDACHHATQNDRLPLRIVVQVVLSSIHGYFLGNFHLVLFTEQLKMRAAMERPLDRTPDHYTTSVQAGSTCCSTKQEMVALKAEVESIKAMVEELHQECAELHVVLGKAAKLRKKSSNVWKKFRNSALFFRKTDGEEVGVGRQRPRMRRVSLS